MSVNDTAGRQPALLTEAETAADFLESKLSLVLPLIGQVPAQPLGTLQPATSILAMMAKPAPVPTLIISAKVARYGNVGAAVSHRLSLSCVTEAAGPRRVNE